MWPSKKKSAKQIQLKHLEELKKLRRNRIQIGQLLQKKRQTSPYRIKINLRRHLIIT